MKWEENYASRIGTHGPGCHMWGPSHYVCAMNKLEEVSKGNAMYEHVRTLSPHQFEQLCADNIAGKGKFDDLVLADMAKRMRSESCVNAKHPTHDDAITLSFYARSRIAIECLPKARYRDMLEKLHADMLDRIDLLEYMKDKSQ